MGTLPQLRALSGQSRFGAIALGCPHCQSGKAPTTVEEVGVMEEKLNDLGRAF